MAKFDFRIILVHVGGWLLFFTFILIFVSSKNHGQPLVELMFCKEFCLFAITYISIFYLNSRLLFPFFYLHKKYALYALVFALLFVTVYFVKPVGMLIQNSAAITITEPLGFGESLPRNEIGSPGFKKEPELDILSLVLFVMLWSLSSAFHIMRQWRSAHEKAAIAEAERANAELSFLKAQINPHFLFNTLNNIYSLAVRKSDNTASAIMKLSKMMRYVTEEAAGTSVPLEDEVECISDYIELQKLRLNEKVHLDFSVQGDVRNKEIAPLILMPFVENIFKYGISNHEQSEVKIVLSTDDNSINFFCRNKIFATARRQESTGIGITNTQKRLKLFYDGDHSLNINQNDGFFTVQLSLKVVALS